ncbi:methyltransferase, FxLD system [Streptomyces sp. TR02-1]|uniref:methyltransferase, FxLD system n=1 Tax=Streptomyces sp. TR02-1 TaxID=3385977 RepID=UPI0039A12519
MKTTPDPTTFRTALVDKIREKGNLRSKAVERAMLSVPRHLFAPEATVEEAYADDVVCTKDNEHGETTSSVSAPWLQAEMLEQSGLRPGMRALEIGSGGYNAALMAEVVGTSGEVVTVDIDPFVTERARRFLKEAGYEQVTILEADGAYGAPDRTPNGGFDAILVTVEAADIPPAWIDQLAPHGRLVVPLRLRGMTRAVRFDREDGHLVSRQTTYCGFVQMQGTTASALHTLRFDCPPHVQLNVDEDQDVDDEALQTAFTEARHELWTGVPLAKGEPALPVLDMWLAGDIAPYGRFHASKTARDEDLTGWVLGAGTTATWTADSFAYVALRRSTTEPEESWECELGVIAHGPRREELAQQLADRVRHWDRALRPGPEPVIRVYPAGTPDAELYRGRVIDKPLARLVLAED